MKVSLKQAIDSISALTPKLIFLTGKSSTGKSYLSNILANKHGYKILELDAVVHSVAKKHGVGSAPDYAAAFAVYKGGLTQKFRDDFVADIHSFIERNPTSPIMIEGAISSAAMVRDIFSKQYSVFSFIYLHPTDLKKYAERMMKRFKLDKKNGTRTLSIWPYTPIDVANAPTGSSKVKQFMVKMAQASKKKSDERYKYFISSNFNIYTITV
jgi:cytidylate kinase